MVFANDLQDVTKFLDPIIFADDTNLFYSSSNINKLFDNVNEELSNVINWFFTNKLSNDTGKTKYMSYHKQTDRENINLKIPELKFNNIILKRVTQLKFLVVMIDKSLNL